MQHLSDEQIQTLTTRLEQEKKDLEEALADQGRIIDGKDDWAAVPPELDEKEDDPTVQADRFQEFYLRGANLAQLEARLVEVTAALGRIGDGSYGIGEISGDPIEIERLNANPAARTTIANKDKEIE